MNLHLHLMLGPVIALIAGILILVVPRLGRELQEQRKPPHPDHKFQAAERCVALPGQRHQWRYVLCLHVPIT
jgi:hypothetical protein